MKRLLLLIIVCTVPFLGTGQITPPAYAGLWTGASVKYKLNKRFGLCFDEQLRLSSEPNQTLFSELGVRYSVNKRIRLQLNYRLTVVNTIANRFSFDFNYRWRKKKFPFSFSYRLRFQDVLDIGVGKTFLRNKVGVGYNLSKLTDPFISFELYYKMLGDNEFRKLRFTLGFDWRISKTLDLATYYRYQQRFNTGDKNNDGSGDRDEENHIVGLVLSVNLNNVLEKKEKKAPSIK